MRLNSRNRARKHESFAAFAPLEALQLMLILIVGFLSSAGFWIATVAGLYGLIARSDAALGTAEIAFQASFVAALGTAGLVWAYHYARQPPPASPKS